MKSVSLSIDFLSQKKSTEHIQKELISCYGQKNISFSRENVLYLLPENTCRGLKGNVRLLEFGGVTI